MSKVKRKLLPVMLDAERRIEQWRTSLLAGIHPRIDVAVYLLVSITCNGIKYLIDRLMPRDASKLETPIRNALFGLQFALSGLKGDLPPGRFIENWAANSLSEHRRQAHEALKHMCYYAYARDVFLTYAWGGYEIENPTGNVLRFVDSSDWIGRRDRAQHVIGQEINLEQERSIKSPPALAFQQQLEKEVDVLPLLSLDNLTAAQFVSAWGKLVWDLYPPYLQTGQNPIMEKDAIVAKIQKIANLSASAAERFISLVTFDRKASQALTLFHCPLVPVTKSSLLAVPPGFAFGDLRACIPRLAVHRGPGLNTFAKEVVACFLDKLSNHFNAHGATIKTNVPYSAQNDSGDVDLVVYESASNRLLIGQVKAFIPPDSVEEVIRANQTLEEGLQQVKRVQRWLEGLNKSSWASALRVPLLSTPSRVQFAVIGNGFAGSDYLPIPQDIAVVDARYLLLSRFAGKSIFDAIDAYQRRLSEESAKARKDLSFNSINLADIAIEFPS